MNLYMFIYRITLSKIDASAKCLEHASNERQLMAGNYHTLRKKKSNWIKQIYDLIQ